MIVKTFKAKKVFGYLDFDIKFNDDISFLVGGNGSGKTTALRLMNALVNPNFKDLLQIPFNVVELEVEEKGELIKISATEDKDKKILKISSLDAELELPSYSNLEFEYYSHKAEKIDAMMEDINRKFSDHEIVRKISEIQSPIFLGLERRREGAEIHREDFYLEREMMARYSNKRAIAARRLIRGSLGISLMETELLVQNTYGRLRLLEERQSAELRDSILLSTFQYSDLEENVPLSMDWSERQGLLQRQKEIKEALSKIGIKDSRLSGEVDKFFHQLTTLFEQLSGENEGIAQLKWLMNKAQIDRMAIIVEIIDKHKSKVDGFYKPINDFLSTINHFYEDSNKKLEIDPVGQLVVKRPDGKVCNVEGLSSGERQLLVIFAHAFFNRQGNKKRTTFIIDEPELSLHLRWQEKFAETIFSINPTSQFILATHSPEIVGINKNKAVMCR